MAEATKELKNPESNLHNSLRKQRRARSTGQTKTIDIEQLYATRRNDLVPGLELKHCRISDLTYSDRLVRECKTKHVEEVANSVRQFGWSCPVLINSDGLVIDGVVRIEAAKLLELDAVSCIIVDHLTPTQLRALRLSLNRQQEKGTWDLDELQLEITDLIELGVSPEHTGFETAEIDLLLETDFQVGEETETNDNANAIPEASVVVDPGTPVISQLGDVWSLGKHRLLCGSALNQSCFEQLMDGKQAAAVFTDPPYNVPIAGNVCGKGKIQHPEFVMASGEMSDEEYLAFLTDALGQMAKFSGSGAVMFVCIDWRHYADVVKVADMLGLELINTCIWVKSNGGMGTLYRSRHEHIVVLKIPGAAHTNNVQLGKFGRNRTNVWEYAGVNTLAPERRAELQMHPTVKPIDLVADAILDVTDIADIVLDPFLGSGTTIMAAERTKRRCFGMELAPAYIDVAIRRWQDGTGQQAIHLETGLTFDQLADQRGEYAADASSKESPGDQTNDPETLETMADTIGDEDET